MRRNRCLAILMGVVVLASAVPVLAVTNHKGVQHSKYNAIGHEFISFVEGPLVLPDLVCYTFTIAGATTDTKKVAMTYRAGFGNDYGYAFMDFDGSTYEIHAVD